jgi:hypothetical protein
LNTVEILEDDLYEINPESMFVIEGTTLGRKKLKNKKSDELVVYIVA